MANLTLTSHLLISSLMTAGGFRQLFFPHVYLLVFRSFFQKNCASICLAGNSGPGLIFFMFKLLKYREETWKGCHLMRQLSNVPLPMPSQKDGYS